MKRAFTLIEMTVVLVVLAIVTHLAMREVSHLRDRKLTEAADRQLETLRACVYAEERDGEITGFLADMGRLVAATGSVATLAELWQLPPEARPYAIRPAVGANVVGNLRADAAFTNAAVRVPTGWRGPYLRLPVGKDELLDPWGNPVATPDAAGFSRLALTNELYAVGVSHFGATALERDRRTLPLTPDGGATSRLIVNIYSLTSSAYAPAAVAWYGPASGLITGAVETAGCPASVVFEGLTPGRRPLREGFTKSVRLVTVRPGDNIVEIKLP